MVIMKFLKFAAFAFIALWSACSVPQYVNVPVSYNPKYYFNPDSTTIAVINQFDVGQAKISNKKTVAVLKAGAYTAIRYAADRLSMLPHVKIINLVDSAAFNVNADSVKTLALKYGAHYVLALKSFDANIDLSEVQNKTAYYNTTASVDFILYESNGIYYKKLKGMTNDAQSETEYQGFVMSLLIHPTVKGNKPAINAAAQHAAQDALRDYFPYTISHNRPLYNDDFLQPGVKAIVSGNYDKADSLLQPWLKHANPQMAGKAAYNLSVVYEFMGDIDSAMDMAQLSLDKFNNQFAVAILAELKTE
jgi:tetratricopeptide (TPR) repeat protein